MPFPNPDTQFGAGQPNTNGGRPKGSLNRRTLMERFFVEAIDPETGKPYVEAATAAIVLKAKAGDLNAYNSLMDNLFNKLSDRTELTGADGGPIISQSITESDEDIINRYLAQKGKTDDKS